MLKGNPNNLQPEYIPNPAYSGIMNIPTLVGHVTRRVVVVFVFVH